MSYITQAQVEGFIKRDLTSEEEAIVSVLISQAKEAIDDYLGTTFDVVSATSRTYDGGELPISNALERGFFEIAIDPCKEVTKVESIDVDGDTVTEYDSDNYILEPANETIKWSVRHKFTNWPPGRGNIKVTAKFTSLDSAVPASVKLAALQLVSQSIMNPMGYNQESIEGYSYKISSPGAEAISQSEDLQNLLSKYKRIGIGSA